MESMRKGTPPYISPKTFHHLLEQLRNGIPDRVDRSYLNTLHSGSTSTQIMSALRYLNLVDINNKPTHHLRLLVAASATPEERKKRLRDIAYNTYGFILDSPAVNPSTATYAQLEEVFKSQCGVDGDVRRKCIKFFTSIAVDTGIPLSPHIVGKMRNTRGAAVVKPAVKKAAPKQDKTEDPVAQPAVVPVNKELIELLVAKFPDMDVDWPDDVKSKWLDIFQQLITRVTGFNKQNGNNT